MGLRYRWRGEACACRSYGSMRRARRLPMTARSVSGLNGWEHGRRRHRIATACRESGGDHRVTSGLTGLADDRARARFDLFRNRASMVPSRD